MRYAIRTAIVDCMVAVLLVLLCLTSLGSAKEPSPKVELRNRSQPNWKQEGIYISFNTDLSRPNQWSKPRKIMEGSSAEEHLATFKDKQMPTRLKVYGRKW